VITKISRLFNVTIRNIFKTVILMALIGLPFILINQYNPKLLNFITEQIIQHILLFSLIRFGIIVLMALYWPYFVRAISHRYSLSLEETAYWQAKRFHIIMWIILFDVLICQNTIGKLIQLIT
jgi:hypothetical protein